MLTKNNQLKVVFFPMFGGATPLRLYSCASHDLVTNALVTWHLWPGLNPVMIETVPDSLDKAQSSPIHWITILMLHCKSRDPMRLEVTFGQSSHRATEGRLPALLNKMCALLFSVYSWNLSEANVLKHLFFNSYTINSVVLNRIRIVKVL